MAILMFGPDPGRAAGTTDQIKRRATQYYYGWGVPQNYSRALAFYLQAAKDGDPQAQYIAGGMYFKGLGTAVDYTKAFELLYKAANNGNSTVESQKVLAQSFILGHGVPPNLEEAMHWYTLAAEQGDPEALNEMGFIYFTGSGVEQDYDKAFELFSQAAYKGYLLSQFNLGIMLYTGNTSAGQDFAKAYAWFSVAAVKGHEQARQAMQVLAATFSPEQLKNAQAQAKLIYEKLQPDVRTKK
jgi:hypothetical protein